MTAGDPGCSLPLIRHHSLGLALHERYVIHESILAVVRMATYYVHACDTVPVVLLYDVLVAIQLEAIVIALAIF